MDEQPQRRRFRFRLISLFALVAAIGVLACYWNPFKRPPSRENLRLIEDGMTVAEVMSLVGPPDYSAIDSKAQIWHGYEISRPATGANPVENWVVVFADGKVVTNSPAKRSAEERTQAIMECAELCLRATDAKKCAQEYVTKLIEDGWNKDDAGEVLNNVLSAIAQLQANNAGP